MDHLIREISMLQQHHQHEHLKHSVSIGLPQYSWYHSHNSSITTTTHLWMLPWIHVVRVVTSNSLNGSPYQRSTMFHKQHRQREHLKHSVSIGLPQHSWCHSHNPSITTTTHLWMLPWIHVVHVVTSNSFINHSYEVYADCLIIQLELQLFEW